MRLILSIVAFATVLIVIFAAGLALKSGAQAQACGSYLAAGRVLIDKWYEELIASGERISGSHIELWLSEGGKTWTILEVSGQGIVCYRAGGKDWRRVITGPPLVDTLARMGFSATQSGEAALPHPRR